MGCGGSKASDEPAAGKGAAPKPQATPKDPLIFSNKPTAAIGDENIPPQRRVKFGLVMPESTGKSSVYIFVDKEKPVDRLIAAAATQGGFAIDKGKLVGSPERLNLFTLDRGDVVRLDLEVEAHMGSTLNPGDTLILEKGNRLLPERLQAIQAKVKR